MTQRGFFDEDDRLRRLSQMGDPLEKISNVIDWEIFRLTLNKVFQKEERGIGGRPPWDYILMFKIILLQSLYSIADDKTEYMINDRLSFQRFLGLSLGDKVPDSKTIWLYRDKLSNSKEYKELFDLFKRQMESQGVITRKGSLIDATFIEAPRQRNTREENKEIKEGKKPQEWENIENKAKLCQKDLDARWTKKNEKTYYGYKDHVKVDRDSKMIISFTVTDASVHDSQEVVELIDDKDNDVNMDSAYAGEELRKRILEKNPNVRLHINEKGYRNRPLTEEQKTSNKAKSKIRARVEHVFGHMSNSMGGTYIRCIGIRRARCEIALKNLAYNLSRFTYLVYDQKVPISVYV
jgi:IS5 family transposase